MTDKLMKKIMLLDPILILYNLSISDLTTGYGKSLPDQRYYLFHTSGQLSLSRCAMHTSPSATILRLFPFSPLERELS